MSQLKSFELPVEQVDMTGSCWLWIGSRDKNGYGLFRVNGVTMRVNRLAWISYNGEIPEGKHVLHTCDTPACVKKEHLFLGTHQENMTDMVQKSRAYRPIGEINPKAKLTQKKADEIRELATQGATQTELSTMFQVSRGAVYHILAGRTWA